ncbi:MAG: hypothetical protein KGI73_04920 [Patescibacteria group bacterium]|nr:hypothetical protein [Patescibacteria group bacterium]
MPFETPEIPKAPAEGEKSLQGRRICSWCKKDMGPADNLERDTHGICEECAAKHFPEAGPDSGESRP